MTSTELLLLFRQEVDDLEEPYLWSDEEIFEFMTDAQRQFCRWTEGIADSRTASVCQISVASPTEWYAKSPLILKVRSATRGDTGRKLDVVNPEHLDDLGIRFDGRTSVVRAVIDGLTDGFFRIYPVPNETVVVNLSVFRLPLLPIIDTDQAFEIAEHHHPHLALWMKKRAYGKQDADIYDQKRADDYEAKFRAYCFQALKEQERARRNVGVTTYGGI